MISSRFSTSAGSAPKRSISSAAKAVDLAAVGEPGDAPVEPEPHAEIGDVILRDQHRRADRDLRAPLLAGRLLAAVGARRGDRLFEHVLVELDADLADMPGLLVAEQIAGAADVEVVARQLKPGAQSVQGLHDFEPALRGRRQLLLLRQGQIGVGAHLAAPDAAAQLVELRQAEHVGAVHDHRVGRRDVEPASR